MFNFLKEDTVFSVRKFMAYTTTLIFLASCVWTMFENKGVLDGTQIAIISGIITFYFTRSIVDKISKK